MQLAVARPGGGFAPAAWKGSQLLHPELGHLRVQRDPRDLEFSGICPFHGDCLEGLACGPAIRARWGASVQPTGSSLPGSVDHRELPGAARGIDCASGLATADRLWWGVMGGYIGPLNDADAFESYIASPGLADRAGLAGAFLLATQASC